MASFGIIGLGSIAKRHAKNISSIYKNARVFGVSSSGSSNNIPENIEKIININELISRKPEFVIIASPAPFHGEYIKILLENNIPILVEKPLAHDVNACQRIEAICSRFPSSSVAVGYCLRFLPAAILVKEILEKGLLGKLYNVNSVVGQFLPNWRNDRNYKDSVSANKSLGGGALLELSHELDYLHWFFGDLTLRYSYLRTSDELELDVEDIVDLVLTVKDDIFVSVHLDFVQKSAVRTCELIGENGRLVWDLLGNSVDLYNACGKENLFSEKDYDRNGMYLRMLKAFEDLINGKKSELANIESSKKIVNLIEAAKK